MYDSRREHIASLIANIPSYRFKQINEAFFDVSTKGWEEVSTLPKNMREAIAQKVPWISFKSLTVHTGAQGDTYKVVLETVDNKQFESVLIANTRGQWTICVSSQIGCAMGCTFCATGTMGFSRNLTSDEIIDQYRFWQQFLSEHPDLPQRISNIVFMGMGEPMANYENVKNAINTWLDYTDLGPAKILVSTIGILPQMEYLLTDSNWPSVLIAISLHSANEECRREIVPTTPPEFLKDLAAWTKKYEQLLGNRTHHLTFEYTLISGVNDNQDAARELAHYIKKTAVSKINIIPCNPTKGKFFTPIDRKAIESFKKIISDYNIDITERRTMGDDILAACGQLAVNKK